MPLTDILVHAVDFAFWEAGTVADNSSTVFALKKNPKLHEQSFETVEKIEQEGAIKTMIKDVKNQTLQAGATFAVTYSIDYMLGIQNNMMNLHHAAFYGFGSMKFMAATHNILMAYGKKDLARKVVYVPTKYIECLERYWDPFRDDTIKLYNPCKNAIIP